MQNPPASTSRETRRQRQRPDRTLSGRCLRRRQPRADASWRTPAPLELPRVGPRPPRSTAPRPPRRHRPRPGPRLRTPRRGMALRPRRRRPRDGLRDPDDPSRCRAHQVARSCVLNKISVLRARARRHADTPHPRPSRRHQTSSHRMARRPDHGLVAQHLCRVLRPDASLGCRGQRQIRSRREPG